MGFAIRPFSLDPCHFIKKHPVECKKYVTGISVPQTHTCLGKLTAELVDMQGVEQVTVLENECPLSVGKVGKSLI